MNCYIFTWDRYKDVGRQHILDFFDTLPEIKDWLATTGAILIISDALTAQAIYLKVHEKFPTLGFLITPTNIDYMWGFSSENTWDFIRKARRS
jgi:hypothetical protein